MGSPVPAALQTAAPVRRFVVVCGYGCNLDSPLRPCLNRVAVYCLAHRPDYIILCGGHTQQNSFPGRSEAEVMYGYLYHQLDALADQMDWHPGWFTEDDSYTTYENIRDAAGVIRRLRTSTPEPVTEDITIFCEATRALKVALLARHFLGFPPEKQWPAIRIETDSWELMHPTLELIATLKDWLATKWPHINTIQSLKRREKSRNR